MKNCFDKEKMEEINDHLTLPIIIIIALSLILSSCILLSKKQDAEHRYNSLMLETAGMKEELLFQRIEIEKLNTLIDEKEQECAKQFQDMKKIIDDLNGIIPTNKEGK